MTDICGTPNGYVYLAAMFSQQLEMRKKRDDLAAICFSVTSTWIDAESSVPEAEMSAIQRDEIARQNLNDIDTADIVISFTVDPAKYSGLSGRGGRHVEFGYAFASWKEMIIVGPYENIFHSIDAVNQFDTWEACLEYLREA